MQPAQLSLLPMEFPAPPEIVLAQLPETGVADAIRVLAHLIAKAAVEGEEPDDEK
jgi:hypothetical protein